MGVGCCDLVPLIWSLWFGHCGFAVWSVAVVVGRSVAISLSI